MLLLVCCGGVVALFGYFGCLLILLLACLLLCVICHLVKDLIVNSFYYDFFLFVNLLLGGLFAGCLLVDVSVLLVIVLVYLS